MSRAKLLFAHKPLARRITALRRNLIKILSEGVGKNPKAVGIPTLFSFFDLFPLNRPGRLRGQIQHYAVDAFYLMGDPGGDVVEEGIGDLLDGGRHGVGGVDRADDGRPALVALAVLYADTLHVRHGNEVLPDLAGKAVLVELLSEDSVGFSQSVQAVSRYRAEAAYSESGTRERLAVYHAVRQTESLTDNTDFIFEEQLLRRGIRGCRDISFPVQGTRCPQASTPLRQRP